MYLQNIIYHKKEEVKGLAKPQGTRTRPLHDPVKALRTKPFIAEIKRASPSRGDINTDINAARQAINYEKGGAGCISVLTDKKFFKGGFDLLEEVSQAVDMPVLCKDFIIHEKQVEQACISGADFILLIAAVLSTNELANLTRAANIFGLAVLYELHDYDEFHKIRDLNPGLVGVNSRNLKTFSIDKKEAMNTISRLNGDFIKIAESGIETSHDIVSFRQAGAGAFLIGTSLMTSSDPAAKMREYYSALEEKPCL